MPAGMGYNPKMIRQNKALAMGYKINPAGPLANKKDSMGKPNPDYKRMKKGMGKSVGNIKYQNV